MQWRALSTLFLSNKRDGAVAGDSEGTECTSLLTDLVFYLNITIIVDYDIY